MSLRSDIDRIADATERIAVAQEGMQTSLAAIAFLLGKITPPGGQPPPQPPAAGVAVAGRLAFSFPPFAFGGMNMDATVPAGSKGNVTVDWVDAFGNPAQVDGKTTWQSSDAAIVKVSIAPDDATSQTAQLESLGPIGPAQIQATADADMGDGVKTITAICNVTVIAGQAVGGVIRPVGSA